MPEAAHNDKGIYDACLKDDMPKVTSWILNNQETEKPDINGCTLLHWNLRNAQGSHDSALLLIESGANVNHVNNNGESVLHVASERLSQINILQALIKAGADISLRNQDGDTALHIANKFQNYHALLVLMSKYRGHKLRTDDNDGGDTQQLLDAKNNFGRTPLDEALKNLNDSTNSSYWWFTALVYANILCLNKANANWQTFMNSCTSSDLDNLLLVCITSNYKGLLVSLLDNDVVKVDREIDGQSILHHATTSCQSEIIKILLEKGADVNDRYDEGNMTPLQSLLENEVSDRSDKTFQMQLCKTLQTLISYGADLSFKGSFHSLITKLGCHKIKESEIYNILDLYMNNCLILQPSFMATFEKRELIEMYEKSYGPSFVDDLKDKLRKNTSAPELQHLCRLMIRRQIVEVQKGTFLRSKIFQLPLPKPTKEFLSS